MLEAMQMETKVSQEERIQTLEVKKKNAEMMLLNTQKEQPSLLSN